MLESSLEAVFRTRVRSLGGIVVKLAPIIAGVPDRMVLLPGGRVYLVELKTEDGRTRPIQRHWHARAAELGTKVVILHGQADVDKWTEGQQC